MPSLDTVYYGNPLSGWLIACGVAVGVFLLLWAIRGIVVRRLRGRAERTDTVADDLFVGLIARTNVLFMLVLAVTIGSQFVALSAGIVRVREVVGPIVLILQGAIWGRHAIRFLIQNYAQRYSGTDRAQTSSFGVISFFAQLVLWSVILLLILDNFGVDINTLIAGLGVGGIAIALAAQHVLSDVFQSVAILLDKPFEVGDFIIVGKELGVVERIGIKTTRLRSLQGEEIVFSNNDLVSSRIQNFKRMRERRIVFTFGVVYETSAEQLEAVPGIVREIAAGIDRIRLDRVHFKSFGDFALVYEVVYYVETGDYAVYMDIQQHFNLALFRRLGERGIEFAYPTQKVYLDGGDNREVSAAVS